MNWREHIHSDPAIRGGRPIIRGTRFAVADVLGYLSAGDSIEDLLEEWPYISRDAILACLAFASEQTDQPLPEAIAAE